MTDAALPNLSLTLAAASPTGAAFAIDLLKVLSAAGLVAIVCARLRIAAIPGYLIAGVLLGPGALGLLSDPQRVEGISTVAIVLLMFGIGLHLDASSLRRNAVVLVGVGIATTLASTAVIALPPLVLGEGFATALAIGMALAMSSTAVVMRLLQQKRELYTASGRLTFAVLLIQDMLAVIFLALIPVLASAAGVQTGAGEAEPMSWTAALAGTLKAVGGVGVMLFVGKLLLPRLLAEAARGAGGEVMLVIAAAVALAAGGTTAWLGLSPELGAFLAGFLLSATPFRFQVSGQIAPVRDLFMAIFFVTVGLKLDIPSMGSSLPLVVVGVVAVLLVKAALIALIAWAMGTSAPVAARTGLTLAQAGEFSLVILGVAQAAGLLDDRLMAICIAVVVLTLIATPGMFSLGARSSMRLSRVRLAPWIRTPSLGEQPDLSDAIADTDTPAKPPACRAIVVGFGPIGRACAERLEHAGAQFTIIELNAQTVRRQMALGRRALFGDATNPEVLTSAGLYDAEAIVLTMPDRDAVLKTIRIVRSIRPDIFIAVRTNVMSDAFRAREVGANHVTVEELATAGAMAEQVLERLGQHRAARDAARHADPTEPAEAPKSSETGPDPSAADADSTNASA